MIDRITRQMSMWMVAGIALGALCGYFLPQVSLALSFVGQLFLGGLKLLVIPLIITGTISGINAFGDMRRAGRFSGQVLLYFLGSLVVAAIIGVALVLILGPGRGFSGTGLPVAVSGWNSVGDALGNLIPGNMVQAISEGKYLGIVLLALFLGGMLTAMGVKGRTAVTLFKNIHEGLLRVLGLLLLVAPLGLFSLIGTAVAENQMLLSGSSAIAGPYLLTVTLALFIHGFLLLPLAVWLMGNRSPFEFFRNLMPAFFTAFGTSSSIATFPVTYRCLSEKCEVDERSTSIVLPLGSVINLQGTVICMVIATLFAAQMWNISFGPLEVIGVAALAVLLSIGAAGIPSATLLAAPVLFAVIGLSAGQIALATGVVVVLDWLVDRLRAIVNVGGDAAGAAILAESFELKTARRTGRERHSSRSTREKRPTGTNRERRPSNSTSRSTNRRTEKPSRSTEPTRSRGRKPVADSGDSPARTRGGRTRSPKQERTPFQMKTPSTPPLGAESGSPQNQSSISEPKAEPVSRRTQPERRRTPRNAETGSTDRRSRSRTPADKQPESKPRTKQAAPPKPASRRRSEPSRPAPVESKPTPPETVTKDTEQESGRLSPSTVARELAKVSAQLREPEEIEVVNNAPVAPETTPKEPSISDKPAAVTNETTAPEPTVIAEPSAPEPVAEISTPVESEPEPIKEEPAPSFGRTRRYKGAALRKEKAAPAPKLDAPEEDEKPKVTKEPPPTVEPVEVAEPVKPTELTVEAPKAEETTEPVSETPTPSEEVKPSEPEPEEPISFGRVKKKRIRK
ncbi:MAG: cation:dicarboxylase symporter family transporter [candidate division Zixibacteria bacterium]|nr:cation:dicarboxylase symporter family transporter [candidate division Zixibacteria bacterium]